MGEAPLNANPNGRWNAVFSFRGRGDKAREHQGNWRGQSWQAVHTSGNRCNLLSFDTPGSGKFEDAL